MSGASRIGSKPVVPAAARKAEAGAPKKQAEPKPAPSLKSIDAGEAVLAPGKSLQGISVKAVQFMLNSAGADPKVPVAGLYDQTTSAAVRAFQKSHGLKQSGAVDAETLDALRSARDEAVKASRDAAAEKGKEAYTVSQPSTGGAKAPTLADTAKGLAKDFAKGAVLGDFSEGAGWAGTAGQVAMGFVPVLGQIADVRDLAAAVRDFRNDKPGSGVALLGAVAGFIPGAGDAAKSVLKGGRKAATEIGSELVETAAKKVAKEAGSEVAEVAARKADDVADALKLSDRVRGGKPLTAIEEQALAKRFPTTLDEFNRSAPAAQRLTDATPVYRWAETPDGLGGSGVTFWQTNVPNDGHTSQYLFQSTIGDLKKEGAKIRMDPYDMHNEGTARAIVANNMKEWSAVPGAKREVLGYDRASGRVAVFEGNTTFDGKKVDFTWQDHAGKPHFSDE